MHVYASLDEFKAFLVDEGIPWGAGSTNDDLAMGMLESASRRVDEWCERSAFGSGFGPRLGVNRYDGDGTCELALRDDLITATTVTWRAATSSVDDAEFTEDDDFFLLNQRGLYEPGPFRSLLLITATFGSGRRVTDVDGVFGYSNQTRLTGLALDEAVDDDPTTITFDVSGLAGLSRGMVIVVGDEQMYVVATAEAEGPVYTVTVDRAVNGTVIDEYDDEAAISRFVYPAEVVDATKRLALKRWTARNAGADGSDGGGDVGTIFPRESEDTILRRTVGHLRLGVKVAS